ncbi:E3 ubiquitin-protein ligase ORTHRUS 2-like [Hordeum vulgare]|nr:E3 ubiquitin-protein ligase ORTHRUS 2-like [Hordeum vulgare]
MPDLPCDGDEVCMMCHAAAPPEVDLLRCATCAMMWNSPCLLKPPALNDAAGWACPDSGDEGASPSSAPVPAPTMAPGGAGGGSGLLAAIREIEADATLSEDGEFRNAGLERSEALKKDLKWFSEQGHRIPEPSAADTRYASYFASKDTCQAMDE